MAQHSRQRISYVLPLAKASAGHRLGVNGLAVDYDQSLLYSAGRDGVLCAWDLSTLPIQHNGFGECDNRTKLSAENGAVASSTRSHKHAQAHTHWINDAALAQNKTALVSASSDTSVKVWTPFASDKLPPQTIGLHGDYVKCLSCPHQQSPYIVAAGLDRNVRLWDLGGEGERLSIPMCNQGTAEKGSVYALAANNTMIATGGPSSATKLWDPRSGKLITQFIGHTDNIRSVLISEDCNTVLTASSDHTIKVWSLAAGRCLSNLAIHTDSVWSLFSDKPDLSVFYSGDRSGVVAKTQMGVEKDLDTGLSVAICQESEGINKIVTAGDRLWAATASSSINSWQDADMKSGVYVPESIRSQRWSIRSRFSTSSLPSVAPSSKSTNEKMPLSCVLKVPGIPGFPMLRQRDRDRHSLTHTVTARKSSVPIATEEIGTFSPLRMLPTETVEGQHGLIKHHLLNDRRRVLTVDSAGEVLMWDLIQCAPLKSFGKRYIHDVAQEVNTTESLAQWCAVDTRTGALTCTLDKEHCFDAEVYADELKETTNVDFREDSRINIGKWILRYLFSNLINEEMRRDEEFRNDLVNGKSLGSSEIGARSTRLHIPLPTADVQNWQHMVAPSSASTPRAGFGDTRPLTTPGLAIGAATPGAALSNTVERNANVADIDPDQLCPPGPAVQTPATQEAQTSETQGDYFSSKPKRETAGQSEPTPGRDESVLETHQQTEDSASSDDGGRDETSKETSKESNTFGKRLRSTFSPKKSAKVPAPTDAAKVEATESTGKSAEAEDSKGYKVEENTFLAVVHRLRENYVEHLSQTGSLPKSLITPPLSVETPVLKLPPSTSVVIQEQRKDSVGVADSFESSTGDLGKNVDYLEKKAPSWLGELLLLNQMPQKELIKTAFTLRPYGNLLPNVTQQDGQERLNANRMLRAKKVLAYVAERLEPVGNDTKNEKLKPEEYLELYCNDQLISNNMTLATIKSFIWRSGSDVALFYKSNGRRRFPNPLVMGAK